MKRIALPLLAAAGAALLAACGGGADTTAADRSPTDGTTSTEAAGAPPAASSGDPRRGGFEVALGEWAVTPESKAIRPGRVTFVIANRGTMPHGFELEREDVEDDGSKVETEILQPGESVEVELDLAAGVYKLECNVEGHDDLGMETLLEVRRNAPAAAASKRNAAPRAGAVAIEAFAFGPERIEVAAGQRVTWTNRDPAEHTVTAEAGGFDSGSLAAGGTFSTKFDRPGEYRYICALHPGMRGVVVARS